MEINIHANLWHKHEDEPRQPLKEGGAKKTDFVVCSCQHKSPVHIISVQYILDPAIYWELTKQYQTFLQEITW